MLSCFGWIFTARPLKRTISPIVRVLWRSSPYFFCESQRTLRWSNSVKGRARILKEKEERNASPVSAFCSAKDRPSRKLFIPPLWLGNLNFRSHFFSRGREKARETFCGTWDSRARLLSRHATCFPGSFHCLFHCDRSGSRARIYFGNLRPKEITMFESVREE